MDPAIPQTDPDVNAFTGEDINPDRVASRRRRDRLILGAAASVVAVAGIAFVVFRDGLTAGPTAVFTAPEHVGTLSRSDDEAARSTALRLPAATQAELGEPSMAVYVDSTDATRLVMVGTVSRRTEAAELKAMIDAGSPGRWIDAGPAGGLAICADADPTSRLVIVSCAWSDKAGTGVAEFLNRPFAESATLLGQIRQAGTHDR
jgi:hypothetical protein